MTTKQAAEYLNLAAKTLEIWRLQGKGPRYRKFGGAVRYTLADLEKFVDASERSSTSDPGRV